MRPSFPAIRCTTLAIPEARDLLFGRAPHPVHCGFDLAIGAGQVYPEVNFTLPPILITEGTWPQVMGHYEEMAEAILRRALALRVPGLVLEFEHLPPMTERPEWGAEITALLLRRLQGAREAHGLRSALRVTPADLRDQHRPPVLRRGEAWERLASAFERSADAGAHILSIESVGGKEVHDEALLAGDVRGLVFGLGVLAARDMRWLWDRIVEICAARSGVIPGGDSACGFANTAMQLAHQEMLPQVLAAVDRAMTAARSLAAFEQGAVGPSKDCAYEGPVLKAITGRPISMEGKSASCAHFSPLGNIAAAMCDLWSNESVQNVRLLSGSAPEAYTELLAYDCRLMNTALERGGGRSLRDWLTDSDRWLSPQAVILSPEATVAIARAIVAEASDYRRTVAAGEAAVGLLMEGVASGRLVLSPAERRWLQRIEDALADLPASEEALLAEMSETYGHLFDPSSYGLS
ncbi:MAG TPA: methyltransferase MtaB domain-containing protein [Candidatus Methylomirabilis sp.]|nr:methyltransferase MtaB domain-containing protein [Candidatus Methylomirabilis sp.]